DAVVLEEGKRLPRLAAARIVPDRDGHARTMAALLRFVQCVGIRGVDHLPGKPMLEAAARHDGKIAVAVALAILLPERPQPAAASEPAGGQPFAPLWIGVEFLVESGHRLVERVAIDAGEAELLAGEAGRGAAPMQRARLGLGESPVVDYAGVDELRDDGVDR